MRVLHIGNIANNAYNNAKFLRRKGVEADVLCYDYTHVMGQPEWEDAEFEGDPDEFNPRWEQVDLKGFRRPAWFLQEELASHVPGRREQRFKGQFRLERLVRDPVRWLHVFIKYRLESMLSGTEPHPHAVDFFKIYPARKWFQQWFEGYDLIQSYATEPIHAMLFATGQPYVAFEHGTMREIPFEASTTGRLLALAYRKANRVLITNPDVLAAAQRLGLTNFQFIPHPVDESKYRPCSSPLRGELMNRHQTDLILFAPSRHNWALKGNDLLLKAFARFTRQASRHRPILILSDWGQEVDRSRALIESLGIGASILWTPPQNKMKLIAYYNAADVVLDQFTLGVFGTVTPEAMACGKPVVMHFDRRAHEWCFAEMPPVVPAGTEDEIFTRLVELTDDPARRAAVGQTSREWVIKHHGWELVADRQIAIYRELLQR
ncbi:MAG: glycosyltransferase [Nitrospira sp.]|nr:glycosyltransferase [Nitrospira sp.]